MLAVVPTIMGLVVKFPPTLICQSVPVQDIEPQVASSDSSTMYVCLCAPVGE